MALGKSPFDGRIARHHNFIVGARPITGPIGKGNGKGNTAGGGHGKGKGGGGAASGSSGSVVQMATANAASPITLATAPTVGNYLLLIIATDSINGSIPSAFQQIGGRVGGTADNIKAGVRKVQSGDPASWTIFSKGQAVLYELSGIAAFGYVARGNFVSEFSASAYSVPIYKSPYHSNDLIFCAINENTASAWVPNNQSGVIEDFKSVDATYGFSSAFFRLSGTPPVTLTGSLSGTANSPTMLQIAAISNVRIDS